MKKKNLLIAGAMLSLLTAFSFQEAQAQTCIMPPSCEDLGYTKTEANCANADMILKCPTDLSKVTCQMNPVPCTVGDILYGDGYCYKDGQAPANISPIAVVFDVANRLAVALTDVKKDGSAGSETMYWSSSTCDSPNLENCTSSITVIATCGTDGRANTDVILASTCNGTYAANAVNAYQTSNCSADFCQKGKWFLPSAKELNTIYSFKSAINNTLSLLSSIGASNLTGNFYWSSTKYDKYSAWVLLMVNGDKGTYGKYRESFYVRPVLAF